MNREKLYEEIGMIEDHIIEEANRGDLTITKEKNKTNWKRWMPVAASFVILLSGAFTVSHLLNNRVVSPGEQVDLTKPNDTVINETEQPNKGNSYFELTFNKASYLQDTASNIYIPGHFTKELTQEDIDMILPALSDAHKITAVANFFGDGKLYNIDITCTNTVTGVETMIQLAKGAVQLDYDMPGKVEISKVYDIPVTAGYWKGEGMEGSDYYASFTMGETGYYLNNRGDEQAKSELTELVNRIVEGGAADLELILPGEIPEWREDSFTYEQALSDPLFGAYVPKEIPADFGFESAFRYLNQNHDYLEVIWTKGMEYLEWRVNKLTEEEKAFIVDTSKEETYDLSLYPIPMAESVPEQLREIVDNPIFLIEDLTLEIVKKRAYVVDDKGDSKGYRMRFRVLYEDILVELTSKGVTPEDIYEMLIKQKELAS